jgi:hypothetical protein
MQVPVQKSAGYRHFTPIIAGSGPGNGPVPAVDGPNYGTSTSKEAVFAPDGPKNGTSTAL